MWIKKPTFPNEPELQDVWVNKPTCDILIKSFERFDCLERLIHSIKWYYPDMPIIIADDSREEVPEYITSIPNVKVIKLPYNIGLSAGRNALLKESKAEYVIKCDDDLIFNDETRIDKLIDILEKDKEVDIIGGIWRANGKKAIGWDGKIEIINKGIQFKPLTSKWKVIGNTPYRKTDLVINFFVARREKLPFWDERLKISREHLDYDLMLKEKKVNVYYTPSVIVGHLHKGNDFYKEKRFGGNKYWNDIFMKKWGLESSPSYSAQETEIRDINILKGIKPNIVVLGVGHSNTTITTKQLGVLGWNLRDADEEYAESVSVREMNDEILRTKFFDYDKALRIIEKFPQPWAIKDPRFAKGTLPYWRKVFEIYKPILLWVKKDRDKVRESYVKRGESPKKVDLYFENCERYYESWNYMKISIDEEQIQEAISLWKNTHCL